MWTPTRRGRGGLRDSWGVRLREKSKSQHGLILHFDIFGEFRDEVANFDFLRLVYVPSIFFVVWEALFEDPLIFGGKFVECLLQLLSRFSPAEGLGEVRAAPNATQPSIVDGFAGIFP